MPPKWNGPAHAVGRAGAGELVAGQQQASPNTKAIAAPDWREVQYGQRQPQRRPAPRPIGAGMAFLAPRRPR
jgi:hypothetical protein